MASISVVITTFNRASLLQATLDALRLQGYQSGDEVLIVDNASTDNTAELVRSAAGEFPVALRYLMEPVRGKSPALNAGIAASRGEILALTDDDVLVAEDWIETIRAMFRDPSLALVGGRVDPRWERPAPGWLRFETGSTYGLMASPLALLHYGDAQPLESRTAVGANLAVRRTVVDALAGFAPNLGRRSGTLLCGEDHDFCQRAVASGFRCEYRPELRVRHWVPAGRLRLRYFLRWFFWSGVTNAVLERSSAPVFSIGDAVPPVPRYLWRQLLASSAAAFISGLRGRVAPAAARLMDTAFAWGYIRQRLADRWNARVARRRARTPLASDGPPSSVTAGSSQRTST